MHNLGKDIFQKCLSTLLALVLVFCAMPILVDASANDSIIFDDIIEVLNNIANSDIQLEVTEGDYTLNFSEDLIEGILTATLDGAVGMQGFFGDHEIHDPHEAIEIIVQFATPPAVALRLIQEENLHLGQAIPEIDFDEQALAAHASFYQQLTQIRVPFFRRHIAPQIFSEHHQLFNGVYMRVSGELVERIAALPEVYAVFPHILPEIPEARNHFDINSIQRDIEVAGIRNRTRVVLLDTGIDSRHPEFASFLDETGRVPGWQYFYDHGTERDHGTQTASEIVAISPEIDLWSIQKRTTCGSGLINIAALEAAVELGADVIYTFGTNALPHAAAVSLAVLDGHTLVIAADAPHTYVSYTFNWKVDAVYNLEGTVRYNMPPSLPSLGDIPPNPGYRFDGWNPPVGSPITEDTTFEARWVSVNDNNNTSDSSNNIRNNNSNNNFHSNDDNNADNDGVIYIFDWGLTDADNLMGQINYNEAPPVPSLGDIPPNPGYRFDGWNPPVGNPITENTIFEARWVLLDLVYTFDWGIEGANNLNGEVEPNSTPTQPAEGDIPLNPGYEFDGWIPAVGPITENTVFEARWIPRYVEYVFDWRLENVENPGEEIRDSSMPILPNEIPVNPGYIFNGWTPLIEPLTEDTVFNAVWIPEDMDDYEYLTYTFDWGLYGIANPMGLVRYDTTPTTPGAVPTNHGYTFGGWSPSVYSIVEDTTFTAIWIPTEIEEIEDESPIEDDLDDEGLSEDDDLNDEGLSEDDDLNDEDLSEDDDLNDEGLSEDDDLNDEDLSEDDDLNDDDSRENDDLDDEDPSGDDLNENNLNDGESSEDSLNDENLDDENLNENVLNNEGTDEDESVTETSSRRPGNRPRPSLPQTGAIAGVSVLGGSAIAASGVVVASIKKKVNEKNSVRYEVFDLQFEEEYNELFSG